MSVRGGSAEGYKASFLEYGEHVVGQKTAALQGVNVLLQTEVWRQAFDRRWYGLYAHVDPASVSYDPVPGQIQRADIVRKQLEGEVQLLITPQSLTANYIGGDRDAQQNMLEHAANLAQAGKLRVARNAVDLSSTTGYSISIYDMDAAYTSNTGYNRLLVQDTAAGAQAFPLSDTDNYKMGRSAEAGFDQAWLTSGVDIVHGPAAHLGRLPAELEAAPEEAVRERTAEYIAALAHKPDEWYSMVH